MKKGYVYIMASESKTLYTGVSSDLEKRVFEHKNGILKGFTAKYSCKKLVYFQEFPTIVEAIEAEKKLKNWRRAWKVCLIEKENPYWDDLSLQWNV